MVSQQHLIPNIIASINITNNLPTNPFNMCIVPLPILTITKYLQFNLSTYLPTILLPAHLPLTSQWDNLAMTIAGTFVPPITKPPTPYSSHLNPSTNLPTSLHDIPILAHLLNPPTCIHPSPNLPTILTTLPFNLQWVHLAVNIAVPSYLTSTKLPTSHSSHLLLNPPIHLHIPTNLPANLPSIPFFDLLLCLFMSILLSTTLLDNLHTTLHPNLLPILIPHLESMHSFLGSVMHYMRHLPPSGLVWLHRNTST